MRSLWRRNDGAAAVEFGLVLPLLMLILLGVLDYGYVYFVRLSMTNAAREGARVGVTRQASTAQTAAENAATTYLNNSGISGASVSATTPSDSAPTVQVTVTIDPFNALVGFVPTPNKMSVSAAMRWELASSP